MDNKLVLHRLRQSDYGTFGSLCLSTGHGEFHLCHTLEPAICDNSYGKGISSGDYHLAMTYSPKFKRELPLISVPGRDGIRIHVGNTADDTQGCILCGLVYTKTSVLFSKQAVRHVIDIVRDLRISKISIQTF